jgi:hypothetical protein
MTYYKDAELIQFCRDMFAGDYAAKKNVQKYIPRLDMQEDDEYKAYSSRPVLSDIPKKILERLVSLAIKDCPAHLTDYIGKIVQESLVTGVCGSLVIPGKHPQLFTADEITAFTMDKSLTALSLSPCENSPGQQLIIDDGVVTRILDGMKEIVRYAHTPLQEIPFVFHSFTEYPPLQHLCSLALDHFRVMADFRNALHHSSLCTAYAAGFPKETVLKLGSSSAWISDFEKATAAFLEFKPNCFPTFQQEIPNIESKMDGVMDSFCPAGESDCPFSTLLSGIQKSLTDVNVLLERFLTCLPAHFHTFPEIIRPVKLLPDQINAMNEAWKSGALTDPEYMKALKRGTISK